VNRNRQSGVALISALLLLATIAVVTGSVVVLGQYLVFDVSAAIERTRAGYLAEGALNRAIFLLKSDIAAHPDRDFNQVDYDDVTEDQRFVADGVSREWDIHGVTFRVRLSDASSMPSLTGDDPSTALLEDWTPVMNEEQWVLERVNRLENFLTCLSDYVDEDDFTRLSGMERDQYRARGVAALPRNGALQFREELLWVPGAREFYSPGAGGRLDDFMVIAPDGLPERTEVVNLYSSPIDRIVQECELSDSEESSLREAREIWRTEHTPLSESLDSRLLEKLSELSTAESGFYSIEVEEVGGMPGIRLDAELSMEPGLHFLEFCEYLR